MNKPRTARPLAELVRPAIADALKAQGFAAADILTRWREIAGERLAAHSMPVRVLWPPRPKAALPEAAPQPATLVLKVESAFALEVEMSATQLVERVNAVFGWRCIGKLRLRQGPVEAPSPRVPPRPRPLDAAGERALATRIAGVEDEGLRAALERLGRGVLGGKAKMS
ncbi:DUF721 domain-containing protein [Labrys wisconsinensis]|uniref:DUF721 domain-containing protein n=1 Tax=Labrys wisconsinensis TaxID=425677 RepID=A0ABU0JAD3_9HYPH|nr:DciA family protein [Labrys wisconsinensis]MDQ0470506.1 hypothetical protein [Labrys wisconsinensis]